MATECQAPRGSPSMHEFLEAALHAEGSDTVDVGSPAFAAKLDSLDNLSSFKTQFLFPQTDEKAMFRKPGTPTLYLCGNSLGLQPKRTRECILEELDKWSTHGVEGHFRTVS